MSPNTIKNLTYLAVALCVMALVYLVYQSIKKSANKDASFASNTETTDMISEDSVYTIKDEDNTTNNGLSTIDEAMNVRDDDDYSGAPSSHATTEGEIVPNNAAPAPSSTKRKGSAAVAPTANGVLEATVTDNDVIDIPNEAAAKANKTPAKAASGGAQEYLVVAGSFSSKENAQVMLDKIKKMGYDKAEAVKFNNSAYTSICVGRFQNQAAASTLATELKGKGIPAFARLKRE